MPTLHLLAAGLAVPVMDDELGRPRADLRQVDLILALLARKADPAMAVGAPQGTVHGEPLVDALRDGAHRRLPTPTADRVLRLDGERGRFLLAQLVAGPQPIEQVEPQVPAQHLFDDLAVTLPAWPSRRNLPLSPPLRDPCHFSGNARLLSL